MEDKNFRRRLISSRQDPIHLPAGYERLEYVTAKSSVSYFTTSLQVTNKIPLIYNNNGYPLPYEFKVGKIADKWISVSTSDGLYEGKVVYQCPVVIAEYDSDGKVHYGTEALSLPSNDFNHGNYNNHLYNIPYDQQDNVVVSIKNESIKFNGKGPIYTLADDAYSTTVY